MWRKDGLESFIFHFLTIANRVKLLKDWIFFLFFSFYPRQEWNINTRENCLKLSFPHPGAATWEGKLSSRLPAVWGCSPIGVPQRGKIHYHLLAPLMIWPHLRLLPAGVCLSVSLHCRRGAADEDQSCFDPWRVSCMRSTSPPVHACPDIKGFRGQILWYWLVIKSRHLILCMMKEWNIYLMPTKTSLFLVEAWCFRHCYLWIMFMSICMC